MKDVTIKSVRTNVCGGVIDINGKEHNINSTFNLLSKIYNEMYNTEYTFEDIVKKYISQVKDKDELLIYKNLIDYKLGN